MAYLRGCVDLEYFTLETYRRIWSACCILFDSGSPISFTSVALRMEAANEYYPNIASMLFDLVDGEPRQAEPDYLIGVLAEKARLRRLIARCSGAINRAALGESSKEIQESLAEGIVGGSSIGITSLRQLVDAHGIDELMHGKRQQGLRLPWPRLNGLLSGMRPGQLLLLAAHTSQGKTSAALQIAVSVAQQARSAIFFSLEMEPRGLFRRLVTQASGVNSRGGTGMLEYEARDKERTAAIWLADSPIWMDSSSRTVPAMLSAIRRIDKEPKLGLVVVDYLQLIQTTGRPESRAREIGNLARELKLAAQEFGVPFLVLSQFNRESAKERRRPELYDLKESGDVENHSDAVIILHATDLETDLIDRNVVAYVPKQREGPRGKEVSMIFRSDIQRFEEVQV